jgi:hypothetical protein
MSPNTSIAQLKLGPACNCGAKGPAGGVVVKKGVHVDDGGTFELVDASVGTAALEVTNAAVVVSEFVVIVTSTSDALVEALGTLSEETVDVELLAIEAIEDSVSEPFVVEDIVDGCVVVSTVVSIDPGEVTSTVIADELVVVTAASEVCSTAVGVALPGEVFEVTGLLSKLVGWSLEVEGVVTVVAVLVCDAVPAVTVLVARLVTGVVVGMVGRVVVGMVGRVVVGMVGRVAAGVAGVGEVVTKLVLGLVTALVAIVLVSAPGVEPVVASEPAAVLVDGLAAVLVAGG